MKRVTVAKENILSIEEALDKILTEGYLGARLFRGELGTLIYIVQPVDENKYMLINLDELYTDYFPSTTEEVIDFLTDGLYIWEVCYFDDRNEFLEFLKD